MRRLAASVATIAITSAVSFAARADDYAIDPHHSVAEFSVKHMMVSTVRGEFSNVNGTIHYDPANVGATTINAIIDASTVDTREPKRDAHLKSPDFLDTAKYPAITFKSTQASRLGDQLKVTGDLTIRGVTKSVDLIVDGPTQAVKDPMGHWKVGSMATTTINRTDFGLTWNKALESGGILVGNDVKITLDIEMSKK